MKKELHVGILADQFINWGGGIGFIRLILKGLSSLDQGEKSELNLYVYIPTQSTLKITVKNIIKLLCNKLFFKKFKLQNNISIDSIVDSIKSVNRNIEIVYYNGTEKDLSTKTLHNNLDFLLPVYNPLSVNFPIPWAGYIFDFQHKYYPEFFSVEEINKRDLEFQVMLDKAKTVIVNAKTVKADVEKFLKNTNARIITLPFCPVLNLDFFELNVDLKKYNLPDKYFMISNQFWKHKDHITAFKAFKLFLNNQPNKNIALVCTGQTFDVRFPNYFDDLKSLIKELDIEKNIMILGYIPKDDQLQILKNCVGLIQSTLFEGGPGGFAVYESVGFGIPSIVSDIPVNLEIEDETVTFFKTGSEIDLANKIQDVYAMEPIKYTIEYLIEKNNESLKKMGLEIISAIKS